MNNLTITLLLALVASVFSDTFIYGCEHGSNNKLNEQTGNNNNNRNNDNRLFNSQNGNEGGTCTNPYDTPGAAGYRKYYYVGSELAMEWVNQHGSGDNVFIRSNFVWQYLCSEMGSKNPWENGNEEDPVRDGRTTNTITFSAAGPSLDDNTGRHEPWGYYAECELRERNKGLWVGYDGVNGEQAVNTRANPGGTQYGYECPEERDYYPYWHPTPWVDIAYLTSTPEASDDGGCDFIKANSFNVKKYNSCTKPEYNNEDSCENNGGDWNSYGPWNAEHSFITEPICEQSEWSRENNLNFGRNGHYNQFNFTIPNLPGQNCTLRLRYNMSTAMDGPVDWDLDRLNNGEDSPVKDNVGNNNQVAAAWAGDAYPEFAGLQMNVNTNQFFRTFQDRTHLFEIRKRPTGVHVDAVIVNFGNKGKRGNLQNVYPGIENDFCPQHLEAKVGDFIHIQFTGPNFGGQYNRNNAAGAGVGGGNRANRVNMVQLKNPRDNYPMPLADQTFFAEEDTALLAAMIGQDPADCDANDVATEQADGNCGKLNASPSGYVDLGIIPLNNTGSYYFFSSRNNHFSNRAMKATIVVHPAISWVAILLMVLGGLLVAGGAGAGAMAHQAKADPSGRAAQLWDRLASIGSGSSLGGGY